MISGIILRWVDCFTFNAVIVLVIGLASICSSQVIETPDGKIEFIGLDKWNIRMIQDTMAALQPGQPLSTCGEVLETDLGFPEASVLIFREPDGVMYWVVTVVEPHLSNRIVYKPDEFSGHQIPDSSWQAIIEMIKKQGNPSSFNSGLASYPLVLKGQLDQAYQRIDQWGADSLQAEQVWHFLQENQSESALSNALWTIQNDSSFMNRMIGAALLVNFPDRNVTWWSLMDAQRDSRPEVSSMARTVLHQLFVREWLRDIDWSAVSNSIRHILNGTNLFSLYTTMNILIQTNVSQDLACELLKDGGDLLLSYVNANHKKHRELARELLVKLSAQDFEFDSGKWKSWIKENCQVSP